MNTWVPYKNIFYTITNKKENVIQCKCIISNKLTKILQDLLCEHNFNMWADSFVHELNNVCLAFFRFGQRNVYKFTKTN